MELIDKNPLYNAAIKDIFNAPKYEESKQSRSTIYLMRWDNGFKINLEMYDDGRGYGKSYLKDKLVRELFVGSRDTCLDKLLEDKKNYAPADEQNTKPVDPFGIF